MEGHVNFGIRFDEVLKLLDDGVERLRVGVYLSDLSGEPVLENSMVAGKPATNPMTNEDGHIVLE